MQISPIKKRSISDEITTQLLREILRGAIKAGEKLPPERELAVRFHTNRNTLREALRNLETMNLVSARQGDGLRVLDFRRTGEINLLPVFLQAEGGSVEERLELLKDVLVFRRILLSHVAAMLVKRATPENFQVLEALVEKQRGQLEDPAAMMETELEILNVMVDAVQSMAIRWIFNTMVKTYRDVALSHPSLWFFTESYCENFTALIAACREGDSTRARETMNRHLGESDRLILEAMESLRDILG
jgi:DNA-binding FadR family transcriptional regulator